VSNAATKEATTSTTKSGDVKALDAQLNQMIIAGDILAAFDKFYADDVVMQENTTDPFKGKELNREREQKFVQSVEKIHGVQLLGSAVQDDRTYSEWELDITFKGGPRTKMSQVAARQWKNGKIAFERFYYKG